MTADYLARVVAIAERETAKASAARDAMRAKHPELAAFVDDVRRVFGGVHAVTVDGVRYGKPPLPPRRDGQPIPPIPGVNNAPERPTSAPAGRQARVVATASAGARHGSGNGLGGGV